MFSLHWALSVPSNFKEQYLRGGKQSVYQQPRHFHQSRDYVRTTADQVRQKQDVIVCQNNIRPGMSKHSSRPGTRMSKHWCQCTSEQQQTRYVKTLVSMYVRTTANQVRQNIGVNVRQNNSWPGTSKHWCQCTSEQQLTNHRTTADQSQNNSWPSTSKQGFNVRQNNS